MSAFSGLRESILFTVGRRAIGEPMSREEAEMPLTAFIRNIFADPAMSATQLALVAATLARHIEIVEPLMNIKVGIAPADRWTQDA